MIMPMIIGINDWSGVKAQSSINPKRHCCKPYGEGISADEKRSQEIFRLTITVFVFT